MLTPLAVQWIIRLYFLDARHQDAGKVASHKDLTDSDRHDITREVADFLRDQGLKQHQLAERANVPQPFISDVVNGDFKKETPRIRRLLGYIRIKSGRATGDLDIEMAIDRYLAVGGEPSLLRSSIEMMTRAYEQSAASR